MSPRGATRSEREHAESEAQLDEPHGMRTGHHGAQSSSLATKAISGQGVIALAGIAANPPPPVAPAGERKKSRACGHVSQRKTTQLNSTATTT